jgi:mannan endo-1,4-beta-mannosidase
VSDSAEVSAQVQPRPRWPRTWAIVIIAVCLFVAAGTAVGYLIASNESPKYAIKPTQYVCYLGVHESDAPGSYTETEQFAQSVGHSPNIVSYYAPWLEPFNNAFANSAASHGAITLVQIDPQNVALARIAAGKYDNYLRSFAEAVAGFPGEVVLSFGHEMNGNWSSWGYGHTAPATFVAAWRHIVAVFRATGVTNVIWLWTVNVVDNSPLIPNPSPWWPGAGYVNWVGIDGYFYLSSQSFDQIFGPTIIDVRGFTQDPILITETGAEQSANQTTWINDLFSGVRTYGLLGFIWFDENVQGRSWRISSREVFASLDRGATMFMPDGRAVDCAASP